MAEHTTPTRNRALDNLRAVAMLLGLVVHGVLPFKATGIGKYPLRDCRSHVLADACYFAVHDFRMQLFFVLAGFAAVGLATRRGVGGLIRNRAARIALPLVLAIAAVAPLMHVLFTYHEVAEPHGVSWPAVLAELRLDLWVGPNFHLWFLYFLALCYLPLVGWLVLSPRVAPAGLVRRADAAFRRLLTRRWKAAALAAVGAPVLWTMPDWWIDTPQGWRPDPVIYLYYVGFFLFGAMLYRHRDLLADFGRRWPLLLAVANVLVLPAMLKLTVTGNWFEDAVRHPHSPAWLLGWKAAAILLSGLYTWLTIEGLIGLFQQHFPGERAWWRYLTDASYWCYLAGFPLQVLLQVWLADKPYPIAAKFLLVNALTLAALLISYELCVRHTWLGLLLNGKRPTTRTPAARPVVLAARVRVPAPQRVPVDRTAAHGVASKS